MLFRLSLNGAVITRCPLCKIIRLMKNDDVDNIVFSMRSESGYLAATDVLYRDCFAMFSMSDSYSEALLFRSYPFGKSFFFVKDFIFFYCFLFSILMS